MVFFRALSRNYTFLEGRAAFPTLREQGDGRLDIGGDSGRC